MSPERRHLGARAEYTDGGTLALIAYAVWPTWEHTQVDEVIARLLDSYRRYFTKVVEYLEGNPGVTPVDLDRLRLATRLARTNALASVDRMQGEPGRDPKTCRC